MESDIQPIDLYTTKHVTDSVDEDAINDMPIPPAVPIYNLSPETQTFLLDNDQNLPVGPVEKYHILYNQNPDIETAKPDQNPKVLPKDPDEAQATLGTGRRCVGSAAWLYRGCRRQKPCRGWVAGWPAGYLFSAYVHIYIYTHIYIYIYICV